MKPKRLYLAHPLYKRHEIRKWELEFEEETGIELVNPFYDVKEREDILRLDNREYIARTMKTKKEGLKIVNNDLGLIDNCDGMLTILDKKICMIGTPMEIFYNSWKLKRPTYTVTNDLGGHPWIIGLSTKIFNNRDEFTKYIIRLK